MITTIQDPSPDGMSTLQATLDKLLGRADNDEPLYLVVFHDLSALDRVQINRIPLDFTTNGQGARMVQTSILLHEHVGDHIYLPIVAGGNPTESGTWTLVDLARLEVGPENRNTDALTLLIERVGDDTVRFRAPYQADSQGTKSWQEFWPRIPQRIDRNRTNQLDLVIAIELSGPAEIVKPRLDYAQQIIEAIFNQPQTPHRIGLIGYRDHQFRPNEQNIIDVAPLGVSGPALQKLALWQTQVPPVDLPTPIETWIRKSHGLRQDQYGAPVEDMLQAACALAWRDRTRRVLLTLGSRPAHPAHKEPDQAMRCPRGIDWQVEHQHLRAKSVRLLAVRDAPPDWEIDLLRTTIDPTLQSRYDDVWTALGHAATPQPLPGHDRAPINSIVGSILEELQAPVDIPLAKASR